MVSARGCSKQKTLARHIENMHSPLVSLAKDDWNGLIIKAIQEFQQDECFIDQTELLKYISSIYFDPSALELCNNLLQRKRKRDEFRAKFAQQMPSKCSNASLKHYFTFSNRFSFLVLRHIKKKILKCPTFPEVLCDQSCPSVYQDNYDKSSERVLMELSVTTFF